MRRRLWALGISGAAVAAIVVVGVGCGSAGGPEDLREAYDKTEHRVPMRDGTTLYTAVYAPTDRDDPRPILITRTPYSCGPYGADRYPERRVAATAAFVAERYILVCQDVRGRYQSDGEFVNMRPHRSVSGAAIDETTDTYDTVEWLLANLDGHNGKVGLWGNSYGGFYTSMGVIDGHPALAAAMPSAPIADWYFDDMHHHGMFSLALAFRFFEWFGRPHEGRWTGDDEPDEERFDFGTPDGYRFYLDLGPVATIEREILRGEVPFWTAFTEHPDYDGFWQARSILPHLGGVQAAVLVVGGLFDAEDLYGPLHTYAELERRNPDADVRLVMGPWRHGRWLVEAGRRLGTADFGSDTAVEFRQRVMMPFFRHHLDGGPVPELAEAWMFETGTNRWHEMDEWPPAERETWSLFFGPDGSLEVSAPSGMAETGFDEYPSDPANPVPYTPEITVEWHSEYMVEDQRFAARRPDVLVYRSDPLEEPVTVAGPVTARVWLSTTGEDADVVVKLVDEYPGRLPGFDPESGEPDLGHTQRMVRSEGFRGRYRRSYSEPVPFEPGVPELVEVPLQDVFHTFLPGHRITVQVQSSLFPFLDRNPQTWVDNIFEAEADDYRAQTHRVWRSPEHPSSIELGVLEDSDLP